MHWVMHTMILNIKFSEVQFFYTMVYRPVIDGLVVANTVLLRLKIIACVLLKPP
jgi:hypothetical protein